MQIKLELWMQITILVIAIGIIAFILLISLLYISETFRKLWFSFFYSNFITTFVKRGGDAVRAQLFEDISNLQSKTPSNQLVILEIGPARGNNFEFYPTNCRVIALDYNNYFEKYFNENKSKFPHIICEKFINGMAEDMNQIPDHSVDVVVATYVLCSVKDRNKSLQEIKRVLKEGGTYYFMEHCGYPPKSIANKIMLAIQLIIQPFWYAFFGGCRIHRQSWTHVQEAGFETVNMHFTYPKKMFFIARAHFYGTAITYKSTDNNNNMIHEL